MNDFVHLSVSAFAQLTLYPIARILKQFFYYSQLLVHSNINITVNYYLKVDKQQYHSCQVQLQVNLSKSFCFDPTTKKQQNQTYDTPSFLLILQRNIVLRLINQHYRQLIHQQGQWMSRMGLGVVFVLIELANCCLKIDDCAGEESMVLRIYCPLKCSQEVSQDKCHRGSVEATGTRLMLFTVNLPVISHFPGNLANLSIVTLPQLFLYHKLFQVFLQTIQVQRTFNRFPVFFVEGDRLNRLFLQQIDRTLL